MSKKPTNRRGRRHDKTGRSRGEHQYAKVFYPFLQSDAYRSLSGAAGKVFWELRSRYNGSNNGQIRLSQQEAADLLRMSKSTAGRAFDELEQKGFIIKTRQGMFHKHLSSEYATTDLSFRGMPASNDWREWQDASKPKTKPRHRPVSDPMGAPLDPPVNRGPAQ